MNIVDVIIILLLISGVVMGYKKGFMSSLVSFIGVFLVVILSFILKTPVSIFLYEHLPFFKFGGIFKGVSVLNIAIYEILSFLALVSILASILKFLLNFTNVFDKLINITVLLTPISKIGGMIVGLIEAYVWVFIFLFIISMPLFNVKEFDQSKLKDKVLNNTPILSNMTSKTLDVVDEFVLIKDKYEKIDSADEFNREVLDLFLKYDVVSVDSVDTLVKKDKLKMNNIDGILNKYRND